MITVESLGLVAGALLSLLFSYGPGVRDWYEGLEPTAKRLVMAAALVVVSAVVYAGSCWNLGLPWSVSCDQAGLVGLVTVLLSALVANQGAYLLSPKRTVEGEWRLTK